jgi:hypothetical protein
MPNGRQATKYPILGNSCFGGEALDHEEVAGAATVRACFIAIIAGRLTMDTFDPVRCFVGSRVNAVAALFAGDFATTTVYDSPVVTSAATLCTTCNR